MAKKNRIYKKDGTPTAFFWSDKSGGDLAHQIVYKQTTEGVKKMRGVYFDATAKKLHRD